MSIFVLESRNLGAKCRDRRANGPRSYESGWLEASARLLIEAMCSVLAQSHEGPGHQLYAEEELQRGADRIFGTLVYNFVRGYEGAMRARAAQTA